MNRRIIVPLMMLASIATLTACTKQEIPVVAPVSTGTETPLAEPTPVTPVTETPTPEVVTPTPTVEPAPVAPMTETPSAATTTTKVMTYQSPGGLDEVEFTVTVENGVITAASAVVMAQNDGSKGWFKV